MDVGEQTDFTASKRTAEYAVGFQVVPASGELKAPSGWPKPLAGALVGPYQKRSTCGWKNMANASVGDALMSSTNVVGSVNVT